MFGEGNVLFYALTAALEVDAQLHDAAKKRVYSTVMNPHLVHYLY
jgi:hypothetical protein